MRKGNDDDASDAEHDRNLTDSDVKSEAEISSEKDLTKQEVAIDPRKKLRIKQVCSDATINIALDTIELGKQAIVFANTKRSAEKTAEDISKKMSVNADDAKIYDGYSEKALKSLSKPTKQCRRLASCLSKGIAFHHAGLTSGQRELIEDAFRDKRLRIICSTPTLAAGLDLPAFRTILKDLKRFGQHGLRYIPTLEYLQMAGRAGRPKYDAWGEAIAVCKSEAEADEIGERYIRGEPEDIYSKLAVEPVLRTYLLSLIAASFVSSKKQIIDFFAKTFWAYQFRDMQRLEDTIIKILDLLVEWEFLKTDDVETAGSNQGIGRHNSSQQAIATGNGKDSPITASFINASDVIVKEWGSSYNGMDDSSGGDNGTSSKGNNRDIGDGPRYRATPIGKRVAEIYIDPLTAHEMIEAIRNATSKQATVFSYLQMVSCTLEIRPQLKVKTREFEEIQNGLIRHEDSLLCKEPSMFDMEYDEFMNSIKTALFFSEWIDEADEDYLLEKYSITPGEIKVKLDIANWLLYSASELARLMQFQPLLKDISKLRVRLKSGAKEELIPLLRLKGIGRARARKLFNNKIRAISDVKDAPITSLVQIVGRSTAINIKEQVGVKVEHETVPKRRRVGQMSLEKYQAKPLKKMDKDKTADRTPEKESNNNDNMDEEFYYR